MGSSYFEDRARTCQIWYLYLTLKHFFEDYLTRDMPIIAKPRSKNGSKRLMQSIQPT